jgi:hypothetical protein
MYGFRRFISLMVTKLEFSVLVIAHTRGIGIASQLELWVERPRIGVTESGLYGFHADVDNKRDIQIDNSSLGSSGTLEIRGQRGRLPCLAFWKSGDRHARPRLAVARFQL